MNKAAALKEQRLKLKAEREREESLRPMDGDVKLEHKKALERAQFAVDHSDYSAQQRWRRNE